MPKYIDVENIRLTAVGTVDEDGDILVSVRDVKRAIDQTPAADVAEVKHGEWKKTTAYPHKVYCSICHRDYVTNEEIIQGRGWRAAYCTEAEYCPHCGAKMDGERKELK